MGGGICMRTRYPSLEGPSRAQFAHKLAATVESGQKGGGAMCALEGSRRTGDFAPSEADRVRGAGARDSRAAGALFTAMGRAKKAERPS
jgi:hypothetical protein